ncbi:S1 family peptidase [Gigaspora margarita]|uniref:S1 family peptidase n=1 Tax=Gigaspora margarita TaxID=4874 RepID=A0A8H4A1V1_GIGMA|nr:S1 family peptidase [Gigaspora margarita]
MKLIYIVISLLLILQSYSVYALQNHPLAILWDIDDEDVPEWLELERDLIAIDDILRPILEEEESFISSFGGTYINIFNRTIIVNTVDFSKVDELLALPQIKPYNNSLYFKEANNSLSQLKNNFVEITWLSKLKHAKNLYILTDMEYNNIVLYFFDKQDNNTEFLNAVKPFNPTIFYFNQEETPQTRIRPRRDVNNSKREINSKLLSGDGIYNSANSGHCSVGFWAENIDKQDPLYIITAGHCFDYTSSTNDFYYLPWDWNATQTNLSYIGPMIYRTEYPDFSVIQVDGEDVSPSFAIRNTDNDQYKEFIITGDAPLSSHGVHACKSGYTTHFTCGFVKGLNGIFIREESFRSDLIVTDLYSESGDSGGPVMSFVSPQNLNSVVLHSIHIAGGAGLSAAHSIDKIFEDLKDLCCINRLKDLVLYLGNS